MKEYALISDFFISELTSTTSLVSNPEYLQKELIFKKLSVNDDIMSFIITASDSLQTTNSLNPAGYRFFTGAVIPEIISFEDNVSVKQSVFYFESKFPFTHFYNDLLNLIIGIH